MNIALIREHEAFVRDRVRSGRSHSASDVVLKALCLLQDFDELRRIRLERLRRDISVGVAELDRGETRELSLKDILAKAHAEWRKRRRGRKEGR